MSSAKIHYIHSLSYGARDKLVGSFVLLALILIVALLVGKVNFLKIFDSVVNYQAVLKNAQGITDETVINIAGIDVGRVYDVHLGNNNEVKIHFFVYQRFQSLVRADSVGEVSKLSLVGDNIIIIKAGSPSQPMLSDDAMVTIKEPAVTDYLTLAEITPAIKKFTAMMTHLSQLMDTINPKVISESSQDLSIILANLRQLTNHIASSEGFLGRILYDKNQQQHWVNLLALVEKTLLGASQRVDEIQPIIANVDQLLMESKKILEETTKLSSESQQLMVDVRRSVNKVEQQLNHLPILIDNVQSVLQVAEDTLQGTSPVHVLIDNNIWPFSVPVHAKESEFLIEDTGLDE